MERWEGNLSEWASKKEAERAAIGRD